MRWTTLIQCLGLIIFQPLDISFARLSRFLQEQLSSLMLFFK